MEPCPVVPISPFMQTSACVRHSRTHLLIYIESRRWIMGYSVVFGVPTTIQREKAVLCFYTLLMRLFITWSWKQSHAKNKCLTLWVTGNTNARPQEPLKTWLPGHMGHWQHKCQTKWVNENMDTKPYKSPEKQMIGHRRPWEYEARPHETLETQLPNHVSIYTQVPTIELGQPNLGCFNLMASFSDNRISL